MESFLAQINSFAEQTLAVAASTAASLGGAYKEITSAFFPQKTTATTATPTPASDFVGPPAPGTYGSVDWTIVAILGAALIVLLAVRK